MDPIISLAESFRDNQRTLEQIQRELRDITQAITGLRALDRERARQIADVTALVAALTAHVGYRAAEPDDR